MLVRRDRPQHVDEQLHSRPGCLWCSIHSSSCCFLGQFVVWFCLHPVRSISLLWRLQQQLRVVLGMYAEIRLIYKPSSVFVHREYRFHLFSSPACCCCFSLRNELLTALLRLLLAQFTTRGPARVSACKYGLVASHGQGGRRRCHSSTYRTQHMMGRCYTVSLGKLLVDLWQVVKGTNTPLIILANGVVDRPWVFWVVGSIPTIHNNKLFRFSPCRT